MNKKSWIAAVVGAAGGAFALYFLNAVPIIVLISVPLGGMIAAAWYKWPLRQPLRPAVGALIGVQAGIVMSVLVVIGTIVVTGVNHYEFAVAVMYFPVMICILSALGGWVTAFFLGER